MKDEGFSPADSIHLGEHLFIPIPTLNALRKNNSGYSQDLLIDVIQKWMDLTEPTWEKLAQALERCDYINIAGKIRASKVDVPGKSMLMGMLDSRSKTALMTRRGWLGLRVKG